jgi:hypothetical protein
MFSDGFTPNKARKFMLQNALQVNAGGIDPRASFAARPPSPGWEQIAPPENPQNYAWAWFKPPQVPHGLILRVPDELYATNPQLAAQWTLRKLLWVAGIDPSCVATWHIQGAVYDAMNGASPLLDAPIPPPITGIDPQIVVAIQPPMMVPPMVPAMMPPQAPHMMPAPAVPVAMSQATPAPSNLPPGPLEEIFMDIETDWRAAVEIERDLVRLRKQLIDMMGRLKNLNRDLTPLERIHSNNQDRKDWVDARRWLRDSESKCWRCTKDHDIGDTSAAGQRKWFEETFEKFVVPRIPFDNMEQAHREFVNHRKLVQTLHNNMSNAYSMAGIDGERRAQSVLARIAVKIREATNRKNFLGVILDK